MVIFTKEIQGVQILENETPINTIINLPKDSS